jgi:predicted RNA-binding Zn-ribbon protein involved in translation (DUF1610 family)
MAKKRGRKRNAEPGSPTGSSIQDPKIDDRTMRPERSGRENAAFGDMMTQLETGPAVQMPQVDDRMLRPERRGVPSCPSCGSSPVVCKMKRPTYASYRCRVCDHVWEEGQR